MHRIEMLILSYFRKSSHLRQNDAMEIDRISICLKILVKSNSLILFEWCEFN